MTAYADLLNAQSPIPYVKNFLDVREADELFAFLRTMTPVREKNKRNSNTLIRKLHYGTYVVDPASRSKARYGQGYDIATAPQQIIRLREKLSEYAERDINYLSILGYADQHDHINRHQHQEDWTEPDQSVWVVSLGFPRRLELMPLGCKDRNQYRVIMPEHGSLYVLPHSYNRTHEHAIPDCKYPCGLRISINTKHETHPGFLPPFVREPGPPRIYHVNEPHPQDAVYVGRGHGDLLPSPYGNYSRHDRITAGGRNACEMDAAAKLADPAFRAEFEKLRGKDLICHCSPKQIREGLCHATMWLRLANATAVGTAGSHRNSS